MLLSCGFRAVIKPAARCAHARFSSSLVYPDGLPDLPTEFQRVRERFNKIYVIVSPARCASTAFARMFWELPTVTHYCHEPFEILHFNDAPLTEVANQLQNALDLKDITSNEQDKGTAEALTIKEMPYQVDRHFPILAALADKPIIFLLRDPRLAIKSRIEKKREAGQNPIYPIKECGFELLKEQIAFCERNDVDHMIIYSDDFRTYPLDIFSQVFERFDLDFRAQLGDWNATDVDIDNLGGHHSHLYETVLSSQGITTETDEIPDLEWFPEEGGFREHLPVCMDIFEELKLNPKRVLPKSE